MSLVPIKFYHRQKLEKLLYRFCFCDDKNISYYEQNVKSGFKAGERTD